MQIGQDGMADIFHFALFYILCIVIFWSDLSARRVPNPVVSAALLIQLFFILVLPGELTYPASEGRLALVGLVIGFLMFLPLYAFRAMGAGDVKFFALLGFWLGPSALIPVWLGGSLLAGAHAVLVRFAGSFDLLPMGGWAVRSTSWLMRRSWWKYAVRCAVADRGGRSGIPYAAYLAVAAAGFVVWRG